MLNKLPPQGSRHLLAIDVPGLRSYWYGCERRGNQADAIGYAIDELARILRARQPTHALFALEGVGSWRKDLLPTYKAKRPPKPPGLDAFDVDLVSALHNAGAPYARSAGHEADDVIAAGVRLAVANELAAVVASADKDLLQLVDDERGVLVWDRGEKVFDAGAVEEKWGVIPSRLTELLALMGDTADGVPGVKGWGKDRALEVLGAGKPLAALLLLGGHWYAPRKFQAALKANVEPIKVCWELVKLRADCLPTLRLEQLEIDPLDLANQLLDCKPDNRPF
jgi:DNA polymerase-1